MTEEQDKKGKQWLFYVAGVQHHSLHKCIDKLEKHSPLSLVCEPENKFDPFAVQIVYVNERQGDVVQVGYVPKKSSEEITASLIRPGKIVGCYVSLLEPDEKPWKRLQVFVREEADLNETNLLRQLWT